MPKQRFPKMRYDKKAGILSIRLASVRSVDSDISGNIVIDYGSKGEIVNLDVMNLDLREFEPKRYHLPIARKAVAVR